MASLALLGDILELVMQEFVVSQTCVMLRVTALVIFLWFRVGHTWTALSPFLIRTSRKGTDVVTPLGLEKYGRIDFSLGKWMFIDPNALKLMSKHVKGPGELVRTFFRSLSRP